MLWSQRTTGNPFHAPYGLYSRYYFPDDVMGFGLTGQQPLRPLNADMALFNEYVKILHKDYTLAATALQLCASGSSRSRRTCGRRARCCCHSLRSR